MCVCALCTSCVRTLERACRCHLPLQGAAIRVVCALWGGYAGAAAGCCPKVLEGAAVKAMFAVWSGHDGRPCRVPLQDAAAGCCC